MCIQDFFAYLTAKCMYFQVDTEGNEHDILQKNYDYPKDGLAVAKGDMFVGHVKSDSSTEDRRNI